MRSHLWFLAILAGCSAPPPTGSVIESRSPAIEADTLAQSVGIETLGQRLTPMLAAGCRLPCVNSSTFSTTEDSQAAITLHVVRGDTGGGSAPHSLGRYAISGFPSQPRGVPQVLVIFGAVNGDLTLDARDAASGTKYEVRRAD